MDRPGPGAARREARREAGAVPKRAVFAVLAWGAATATAMAVVWAGLDSVLPTDVEGPHVATVAAWPVQVASTGSGDPGRSGPAEAGSATSATPARPSQSSSTQAASASPSRPAPSSIPAGPSTGASTGASTGPDISASPTPSATQKRYSTPGGTAVLTLYPDSAVLDAATPADGYSARTWTNSDFLEVEFSPDAGGTVYEVIATWNGTSPQVQTYAVGG
jgi:hypothetical protein